MKTTKIITSTLFIAAVSTAQAFAHATFVDGSAEQESTVVAALQVPHGCEGGLATTEVQIKLPEGFISAAAAEGRLGAGGHQRRLPEGL